MWPSLGFEPSSKFGSPTGKNRDLSGAGNIEAARGNQCYPNPGKKRGQGTKEKIAKGNCRHNLNISKGREGGRIRIGKGIYQQNLIYCSRKNQDPAIRPKGLQNKALREKTKRINTNSVQND